MFKVVSPFQAKGDQPQAIHRLVDGVRAGLPYQTLLGVTGSGKTFTMAKVIEALNRPTLVMAPNKTLAAQLYQEFKQFFPDNAVEYFVSYYDYYQPEAYVPSSDTYIEKDARINDEIDKLRHASTRSILLRRDTLIVASVSCIYNLGSPKEYEAMLVAIRVGETWDRDTFLMKLVSIQYERNDYDFWRGCFRVRGDVVEVFPPHEEKIAWRISWFGDEIEAIEEIDFLTGQVQRSLPALAIYPGSHYATGKETIQRAVVSIKHELKERLAQLRQENKLLEAQRLEQRTQFDLELMEEVGFCRGIENYTRHITGARPGERPYTLLDYFPKDMLCVVDESHVTIPQIGGMYFGDRNRKQTLVDYGFRLPSALDNRPMTFEEFEQFPKQVIFVSATPGSYEIKQSHAEVVEQIIRPTGLLDPQVEVRPVADQVDDLLGEVRRCVERNQRVLVTTLTKRMAEELTEYFSDLGVRVKYLHSDIKTLERVEILQGLREGAFDVLVGINLLREGLDLPEVALVAILDADKEGFLRSERSLIQTFGRAARNVEGRVICYADHMTQSLTKAIGETHRRRQRQDAYNKAHGITPQSTRASIHHALTQLLVDKPGGKAGGVSQSELAKPFENIEQIKAEMFAAAKDLDFERAAQLRDRLKALQALSLENL